MENKKDIFKILIPVIAVVIVVESVMVVSGLKKKPAEMPVMVNETGETGDMVSEPVGDPVADFVFSVDSKSMRVGQEYNVEITVSPKESFSIDALDLYLSYDPSAFNVSSLVESAGMPSATSKQVSEKRGIVLANFWFMDESGYSFEAGKPISLVGFTVTPTKAGSYTFELNKQADLGKTKLVSGGDRVESLAFGSDPLEVTVEE